MSSKAAKWTVEDMMKGMEAFTKLIEHAADCAGCSMLMETIDNHAGNPMKEFITRLEGK